MTEPTALPTSPDGWAFFLDVDGTLIDLADTPDAVVVPPDLPAMLERLSARAGGALALVSGRAIATLDRLFAPARLPAAGVHGAELRRADGRIESAAGPSLDLVRTRLRQLATRHPALLVEDKGPAIAVHYRAAPGLAAVVEAALRETVTVDSGLEIQPGKMVFELRPAGADKGHALEAFMAAPPFAGRRPLAVGDDLTDEAMFAAAVRLGGLAVRVGAKSGGHAAASLADSAAVRAWLADLAANRR